MKYIVENFNTCEVIAIFESEEGRQAWIDENVSFVDHAGYMKDGTRISIYEENWY